MRGKVDGVRGRCGCGMADIPVYASHHSAGYVVIHNRPHTPIFDRASWQSTGPGALETTIGEGSEIYSFDDGRGMR